jgi:hypothetical protein
MFNRRSNAPHLNLRNPLDSVYGYPFPCQDCIKFRHSDFLDFALAAKSQGPTYSDAKLCVREIFPQELLFTKLPIGKTVGEMLHTVCLRYADATSSDEDVSGSELSLRILDPSLVFVPKIIPG